MVIAVLETKIKRRRINHNVTIINHSLCDTKRVGSLHELHGTNIFIKYVKNKNLKPITSYYLQHKYNIIVLKIIDIDS